MDENKKPKRRVSFVWPLAGLYLLILAYRLVRNVVDGTTSYPVMAIAGAAVFAGIGGFLLYREWKAYQYDLAHKDDPTTWSDDPSVWEEALEEEDEEDGEDEE